MGWRFAACFAAPAGLAALACLAWWASTQFDGSAWERSILAAASERRLQLPAGQGAREPPHAADDDFAGVVRRLGAGMAGARSSAFIFQHVGKAGGGTVKDWLAVNHVAYRWCHPASCLPPQGTMRPLVLLNVRDPLDRFVSAWDWARELACRPAGHPIPERRTTCDKYWNSPTTCCKAPDALSKALFHRYHEDANELAADLCSNSTKLREDAQTLLRAWLPHGYTLLSRLGAKSINVAKVFLERSLVYPIVLEHGFDFTQQLSSAVTQLLSHTVGREAAMRMASQYKVLAAPANKAMLHSSKKADLLQGRKTVLTDWSARCFVKYYIKDYELIRILEGSCRDGPEEKETCTRALQAILDRRSGLFPQPLP